MAKSYTIVQGQKVVLGPTSDYDEVKAYVGKLSPTEKAKCSVKVKNVEVAAGALAEKAKPATVKQQPPQEQPQVHQRKEAPAVNQDQAFGSYLEGSGSSDLWKPKDGRNLIRILPIGGVMPSDWKTPYPFVVEGVHPNVGLSLNDTIYCPRLTHGQACPICNFSWNLYNSGDKNDQALSKRIRSYRRVLANILDLSNLEAGVQKFAFGKKLAEKILSYKSDPEYQEDDRDFLDPEVGRNFILIKKKVDNYPNYDDSRVEVKITALSQIYPNWRAECHNLVAQVKPKTYDEMMKVLTDTKQAILTTDPNEWDKPNNRGASARTAAPAVDPELEIPIIEEDAADVADRLGRV